MGHTNQEDEFPEGMNAQDLTARTDRSYPNAQTVVDALIAVQNAHDIEAVVDCFSEGATVTLMVETLEGKSAIRKWQEKLAADHFHIEPDGPMNVDGNHIPFAAQVEQDGFKSLGLAHLGFEGEIIIRNGKIERYTFKLSPESQGRFEAARAKVEPSPESS